jgi:predicted nucleic acid-binding protein
MEDTISRIFLDTNVYIIGAASPESHERLILNWLGFEGDNASSVEVVVSQELVEQISRVAKRLKNKDWSGEILARIWQNLNVCYVLLEDSQFSELENLGVIPREDIGVYLTAREGKSEYFISSNHELIRSIVEKTKDFECLTPKEFVTKYL